VTHQLPRFGARGTEPHAVGDRIEATFEQLQQVFTGLPFAPFGFCINPTELVFQNAIDPTDFLLRPQLLTVTRETTPRVLPVLTGRIGAALERTFVGETLLPFQEEFFTFTPTLTAFWITITCH
jgi:hypothetical protein